jgi:hypothetical protein
MRRITFAFRVFGMSPTKITSRGASALPRSRATFFFQFGGEGDPAAAGPVCVLFQYAKANQRFAFDGIRHADPGDFAHFHVRDEDRFENFWRHESILPRTNARFLRLF